MLPGKVWLVGAGPGDIGLFTVKGMEVLKKAEVVVYDSLVGQGVLSQVPDGARLINVGKRASCHTMPQEEINQVLLEEAKKGCQVVRLKGGDPFLFGRGGEELELLAREKIPYEVVPGVTSPLAVPAYNGIPVTHRDFCSSLHIITGHKRAGEAYDIDFDALVRTRGTLVFLMGLGALGEICSSLLEAGMEPDMPAAVLEKGTTAGQRRVVATLATLKDRTEEAGIQTPAIIVVGKVCGLSEAFAWYESLPLAGWKVVVTRPKGLISQTAARLREKGAEVLELPAICTEEIRENPALLQALSHLGEYRWLVFTSPTGVEVFFQAMFREKKDLRSLGGLRIAAIGEGTAKKLRERGLFCDLMPEVYDGDALGEALAAVVEKGDRILIPRAEKGNAGLVRTLLEAGAQVEDVATYRTLYQQSRLIDEKKELEDGRVHCVVFTSASTVKGFVEGTRGLDYRKVRAACIGKQTKAAADAWGMQTFQAKKATIDSLIQLVEEMKRQENRL
ncbi:MAG: uroporphyrinogen-III C-methyltransferase [Eubacteriales bacterium]|nr:uroporphyrinogen-III C-methyltransferase [Eubacteriales bacterium]